MNLKAKLTIVASMLIMALCVPLTASALTENYYAAIPGHYYVVGSDVWINTFFRIYNTSLSENVTLRRVYVFEGSTGMDGPYVVYTGHNKIVVPPLGAEAFNLRDIGVPGTGQRTVIITWTGSAQVRIYGAEVVLDDAGRTVAESLFEPFLSGQNFRLPLP